MDSSDGNDLVAKTADALQITSRNFYEQSKFKIFVSIVYFAMAFLFLGMCSQAGGKSNSATWDNNATSDGNVSDALSDLTTGYGFAAFFYFCAFVIMVAAGFHISPLVHGSVNEGKTLRAPLDLERS